MWTHTHTHKLSLSLSLSLTHTHTHTHTHTLTHTHTHTALKDKESIARLEQEVRDWKTEMCLRERESALLLSRLQELHCKLDEQAIKKKKITKKKSHKKLHCKLDEQVNKWGGKHKIMSSGML